MSVRCHEISCQLTIEDIEIVHNGRGVTGREDGRNDMR